MNVGTALIRQQIEALNRKLARQNNVAASTAAEIDRVQRAIDTNPSDNLSELVSSLDTKLKRQLRASAITAAYIELLKAETPAADPHQLTIEEKPPEGQQGPQEAKQTPRKR